MSMSQKVYFLRLSETTELPARSPISMAEQIAAPTQKRLHILGDDEMDKDPRGRYGYWA